MEVLQYVISTIRRNIIKTLTILLLCVVLSACGGGGSSGSSANTGSGNGGNIDQNGNYTGAKGVGDVEITLKVTDNNSSAESKVTLKEVVQDKDFLTPFEILGVEECAGAELSILKNQQNQNSEMPELDCVVYKDGSIGKASEEKSLKFSRKLSDNPAFVIPSNSNIDFAILAGQEKCLEGGWSGAKEENINQGTGCFILWRNDTGDKEFQTVVGYISTEKIL